MSQLGETCLTFFSLVRHVSHLFQFLAQTLCNGKNSIGESSAPCGNPDTIGSQFGKVCWHTTLCLRSRRNVVSQRMSLPLIPWCPSLSCNICVWLIQSTALVKSKYTVCSQFHIQVCQPVVLVDYLLSTLLSF